MFGVNWKRTFSGSENRHTRGHTAGDLDGVTLIQITDQRISEDWQHFDRYSLTKQLRGGNEYITESVKST